MVIRADAVDHGQPPHRDAMAGNWNSYWDYTFNANSNEILRADSSKAGDIANYMLQLGEFFERRVQLLHIGRVMLVVMQHHRARVDARLEGRIPIGQGPAGAHAGTFLAVHSCSHCPMHSM